MASEAQLLELSQSISAQKCRDGRENVAKSQVPQIWPGQAHPYYNNLDCQAPVLIPRCDEAMRSQRGSHPLGSLGSPML